MIIVIGSHSTDNISEKLNDERRKSENSLIRMFGGKKWRNVEWQHLLDGTEKQSHDTLE